MAQLPGAMPTVSLRIDRSELGPLALKVGSGVYFGADPKAATGLGLVGPLAVGQSSSATKPDNAGANQALSREPFFRRIVSFRPEPSCPRFASKVKQTDEEGGEFLVGRSASFFWDDLKEVPNRYLTRWQSDKLKQGGLPLEDLLDMADGDRQDPGSGAGGGAPALSSGTARLAAARRLQAQRQGSATSAVRLFPRLLARHFLDTASVIVGLA